MRNSKRWTLRPPRSTHPVPPSNVYALYDRQDRYHGTIERRMRNGSWLFETRSLGHLSVVGTHDTMRSAIEHLEWMVTNVTIENT